MRQAPRTVGARDPRGQQQRPLADGPDDRALPSRALGRQADTRHGLAGEEIPLAGRIAAVADVFDALTHERPYKRAWERGRGRRRDPRGLGQSVRSGRGRGVSATGPQHAVDEDASRAAGLPSAARRATARCSQGPGGSDEDRSHRAGDRARGGRRGGPAGPRCPRDPLESDLGATSARKRLRRPRQGERGAHSLVVRLDLGNRPGRCDLRDRACERERPAAAGPRTAGVRDRAVLVRRAGHRRQCAQRTGGPRRCGLTGELHPPGAGGPGVRGVERDDALQGNRNRGARGELPDALRAAGAREQLPDCDGVGLHRRLSRRQRDGEPRRTPT